MSKGKNGDCNENLMFCICRDDLKFKNESRKDSVKIDGDRCECLDPMPCLDGKYQPEILVLGTFPGPRTLIKNKDKDAGYYLKAGNRFWKILDESLCGDSGDMRQKRENFLKSKKIILWDVLKSADREKKGKDEGKDSDIIEETIEVNDILGFLQKNTSIKKIIVNGDAEKKSASYFFKKFFKDYIKPLKENCDCEGMQNLVQVFFFPSTSASNGKNLTEPGDLNEKKQWIEHKKRDLMRKGKVFSQRNIVCRDAAEAAWFKWKHELCNEDNQKESEANKADWHKILTLLS